jgi:hypothetical protein
MLTEHSRSQEYTRSIVTSLASLLATIVSVLVVLSAAT